MATKKIALIGEYGPDFKPHPQTARAIEHSARLLDADIYAGWVSTDRINETLSDIDALLVAPGSPYRNFEKTLEAIQYAREYRLPTLGTCGGFQHMIVEYARNVLGREDAQHALYQNQGGEHIISELSPSISDLTMDVQIQPGSRLAEVYRNRTAREKYYSRYGVNPEFAELLDDGNLKLCGRDENGEVRAVELSSHPFYIGTLFVPQNNSSPEMPHPLMTDFVNAVIHQGSVAATVT